LILVLKKIKEKKKKGFCVFGEVGEFI